MVISRNPLQFLRRHGLVDEPVRPRPRLDVMGLLVHTIPLASPPKPPHTIMRQAMGDPPPDRPMTQAWPAEQ